MKILAFSDLHGNIYALNKFIEVLPAYEVDMLLFCGDIFGYYYKQKQIIERLDSLKNLIWLRGNHDQYFLDANENMSLTKELISRYGHSYDLKKNVLNEEYVNRIKMTKKIFEMDIQGYRIGAFHGTPQDALEGRLYPNDQIADERSYEKYNLVILGHTHFKMIRYVGNTLVVNPGSLGQPRDGKGYGFAIIDTDTNTAKFHNVKFEQEILYQEIEQYDPKLKKLKEVLERENEKNISDGH